MARILVIDDVPSVTALLRLLLEGRGHAVAEAHDGAAGLKAMEAAPFDLVVVDMMMPGMDGIELVKRLRDRGDHPAVIAMSGGSDEFPAAYALKISEMHGADRLLYKPFGNDEFLDAVAELLGHPSS
ncbi:response regulator transcription factor [Azospirillum rugosum]|uniref:Two-component system response regulator MprA n=1 Tax=Azospirillum rugosum TaxID=416170 RepID=A0ABS4SS94_9PROT|nr:response regulator [Azospirillum rugosum]MBP2295423.1 two-component system response regulator MprA [Azospirillum rugosum]MDQ0528302.1 two-component system response regulator MprA [Azospirillum rugosum]